MPVNHFMKVREVAKETGISEGLLYDWLNKEKVPQRIDEYGVKLVSLDAVTAYHQSVRRTPKTEPSTEGKVLTMVVTDGPADKVVLPGRQRSASSSLLERRNQISAIAEKMLSKDKALTGMALHRKVKDAGIQAGNRLVYEVLNSLRKAAEKKKAARVPVAKRYGTFEYFCENLRGNNHHVREHGITSIQMTLDAEGKPKWTIRREQAVTL